MGGFLYFIEGMKPGVTDAEIDQCQLRYAFDAAPDTRQAMSGPADRPGRVIARSGCSGRLGYFPESQVWFEADGGKYWIGYERDEPPKPSDLARPEQLPGEFVTMADGNEWLIPHARSFSEIDGYEEWWPALPQTMRFRGGEWQLGGVLPKYSSLYAAACDAWDSWITATASDEAHPLEIGANCATVAIASNYYVGENEASELGLYTTTGPHLMELIKVLTGLGKYLEWAQKKTRNGASTQKA